MKDCPLQLALLFLAALTVPFVVGYLIQVKWT